MTSRIAARLAVTFLATGALVGCGGRAVIRVIDGRELPGRFVSDRAYALYARGAEAEARGDRASARLDYLAAAGADDDNVEVWTRIGAVTCALGRVEEARKAFEIAASRAEDYEPLFRERAACALTPAKIAPEDAKEAFEDASRALALDPESEDAVLLYARAAEAAGSADKAERALRELVASAPGRGAGWRALRDFAVRRGDRAAEARASAALDALAATGAAPAGAAPLGALLAGAPAGATTGGTATGATTGGAVSSGAAMTGATTGGSASGAATAGGAGGSASGAATTGGAGGSATGAATSGGAGASGAGASGEAAAPRFAAVDAALGRDALDEARALAKRLRLPPSELAVRAAALGRARVAKEQAELVFRADPSSASAAIALAAACDLMADGGGVVRALASASALTTPPSPLARLLLAELLARRVDADAARAWLGTLPAPPDASDPLLTSVTARLAKKLRP